MGRRNEASWSHMPTSARIPTASTKFSASGVGRAVMTFRCRRTSSVARLEKQRMRDAVLARIKELQRKVGAGLSRFVVEKYAGGSEPETRDDHELAILFQKLTDIGNGIDRLHRAVAKVGNSRYAVICRELN